MATRVAIPDSKLLDILLIGHETTHRGAGISLQEALTHTDYRRLRGGICESDLERLIHANPKFIEIWEMYSEDKRTGGGWYLLENGEIGQVDRSDSSIRFASMDEAVAAYVLRELDCCAGIAQEVKPPL